jgi:hypothetical protein
MSAQEPGELDFALERGAILGTAVGIARMRLERGEYQEALEVLDEAAGKTRDLLRDRLVEMTHRPADEIEAYLGYSRRRERKES